MGVAAAVASSWGLAVGVAAAVVPELAASSGLAGLGALIVGSGVEGMLLAAASGVEPVSTDLNCVRCKHPRKQSSKPCIQHVSQATNDPGSFAAAPHLTPT